MENIDDQSDNEIYIKDEKIEIESLSKIKFTFLFLASLGLYGIWWMYKVWKRYKVEKGLNIMPAARAIFAVIFIYSLFQQILFDAKSKNYEKNYSSNGLFILFIITSLISRLPDPFWLLTFVGVLVYLKPLEAYNYSIEKSDVYKLKKGFNNRQLVILVFGGIVWLLMALVLFMPEI